MESLLTSISRKIKMADSGEPYEIVKSELQEGDKISVIVCNKDYAELKVGNRYTLILKDEFYANQKKFADRWNGGYLLKSINTSVQVMELREKIIKVKFEVPESEKEVWIPISAIEEVKE